MDPEDLYKMHNKNEKEILFYKLQRNSEGLQLTFKTGLQVINNLE